MDSDTDQALLAAVARTDTTAFDELYRRYERRVHGYLRSIVRDETMTEDLVIDTMTEVWRAAGRFESRSQVSTWILGIARHKAIDAIRKRTGDTPTVAIDATLQVPDCTASPHDIAASEEVRRIMQRAFTRLSPDHQEALRLAFFEELRYEQIAALLGIPANTVKSRVYYAKEQLRRVLAEYPAGPLKP
jgi:RNA polymerase sigma-70 factor, ECF subfamily